MKRLFLALLFAGLRVRADITGYGLTTPALDMEIHPRLVAAAPNGNVWFAEQSTIGFFTPSGHVTSFTLPHPSWALAADRDGSVWFIDNASAIGHLTADGQFTFFQIPTRNAAAPVPNGFGHSSIAIAPDGAVWFTENATFKAGKLTPSTGAFIEYPLEGPEQPSGITVGADGKVWFTAGAGEIAMIIPPSTGEFVEFNLAFGSLPLGITAGPDGNIWIAETGRSKIARLKPSGLISEFSSDGAPQHIVTAPDGTLWYTTSTGIGRITLDGSGTPAFETIATPGQQNFDITVTSDGRVYFTGNDRLSLLAPLCAAPIIHGPYELTSTRSFRGAFSVEGREPLNITIQNLPASWSAQIGTVTIIDSGPSPAIGTYTFTISVTDAEGCSASQQITVHIVDNRKRSARH